MLGTRTGCFKDFTCFAAFLALFGALDQSVYGQQGFSGLPEGVEAGSGRNQPGGVHPRPRTAGARTSAPLPGAGTTFRASEGYRGSVPGTPAAPVANQLPQAILKAQEIMQGSQAPIKPMLARAKAPAGETFELGPDFSPSGFRLKPKNSHPARAAAKTIGKAVRPLQLLGPDDATDPYIVNKAIALSNNPQQIFAFVRDQTLYQVYAGSLRGARGTLWTAAGNALDRSSLLVALFRAAGLTARYVQGTLSKSQAQSLILGMFGSPYRLQGCLPPNTTGSDPANDSRLLSIAGKHYWVEYSTNGGASYSEADPSFPNSQLGQSFGTPAGNFTQVPSNLQHTISFELQTEIYNQALAAFLGNGSSTTTVLSQNFVTSTLVGKPVSVGQYVNSTGVNLVFSASTNIYSPYLMIGEDPANPAKDDIIRGADFQEVLTNFPLSSEVLTGLFLNITVTDSSGNSQTYNKTLYDAIGFAARTTGGGSVSINSGQNPSLSTADFTTINVLPSKQDQSIISAWSSTYDTLNAQLKSLTAQLPTDPNYLEGGPLYAFLTPAQQALQQQAQSLSSQMTAILQRGLTAGFAYISDLSSDAIAIDAVVTDYLDSPRLIISSMFAPPASGANPTLQIGFDLLKDDIQVLQPPGQSAVAAFAYRTDRGLLESYWEGQVLSKLMAGQTGAANASVGIPVSATDILSAALQQGITLIVVTPGSAGQLNASADAKARVLESVTNGNIVLAPVQAVTIGGVARFGWLEIASDGTSRGVLESGDHGAFDEYAFLLKAFASLVTRSGVVQRQAFLVGFIGGFITGIAVDLFAFGFYASLPGACPPPTTAVGCYKFNIHAPLQQGGGFAFANIMTEFAKEMGRLVCANSYKLFSAFSCDVGFAAGLAAATNLFTLGSLFAAGSADPPLPPALIIGTVPPTASPGGSPGVTVNLVQNSLFALPIGNAPLYQYDVQVPTVFDAFITNTGPAADTFNLSLLNPPSGFTLSGSLPTITIPAGTQAQIGVCAYPTGTLPAPGTNAGFNVKATSTSNTSITATGSGSFTVPAIPGISLTATGSPATVAPVVSAPVQLQIQGTGNVATTATLTSTADTGLTVSGLGNSVTVNPGQTITQNLTLTPGPLVAFGTTLNDTITAAFGNASPQQTTVAGLSVTVEATQAMTAGNAARAAAAAGRPDIAATLFSLSGAINSLVAGCTSTTLGALQNFSSNLLEQIVGSGNSTFFNNLFNGGGLQGFTDTQNATCGTYNGALAELNTFITNLNNLLSSPAAFPFQLNLAPATVVAQPNSTSTFKVVLQNQSQVSQTYNLSVSGIPAGLGGLNTNSVTLAAQQSVPVGNATDPAVIVSQTGNTLQAFSFTVTASPAALPSDSQSTAGTVNLRPDVIDVQDVTAVPGFVNGGASVDIVTHIANAVNEPTPVKVSLKVLNSSSQQIASAGPVAATMTVATLLTGVDFGQVTIPSGTPNGNYTLSVTVTDAIGNTLGAGTGFLLVGSPVTATLTVTPQTVPSGSNTTTVLNTLTVSPTAGNGNSLVLVGSVATASPAVTVALNGTTAYVCDQNEVSVVDVSNPAGPTVLTTALSTYIANADSVHCSIQQGDLVVFSDTSSTLNGNNPGYLVFGLSNPQSPNLLAGIPFPKRFVGDPVLYLNTTAFLYTDATFFTPGSPPFSQAGDVVSVNLATITNPVVQSTLSINGDSTFGGPSQFFGETLYSPQILYAGSSTNTKGNFGGGAGALDVIDIADPTHLSLLNQVTVSSGGINYIFGMLNQGNLLVARANTGTYGPTNTPNAISNAEFILVFDISNPQGPVLLSVTPTNTFCCNGGNGAAILGPNQFLFGGVMDAATNGKPLLELVDTTNPAKPIVTPISVPVAPNSFIVQGNYLYAPTPSGLSIYSVPGNKLNSLITGYTAIVQTSNTGNVTYDPASFNVAPNKITHGSGFDAIEWDNPSVSTLTWNSRVTGLQPAQLATVDQGGTLTFTSTLGNGTVNIGPVDVNANQIISLTPASQTLAQPTYPGAQYTLTVRNPTTSPVTYQLSAGGIPRSWITTNIPTAAPSLPASSTVPAQGAASIPFTIIPDLYTAAGTYNFDVAANATGLYGAVEGTLIYTYQFPTTIPAGPGGPGTFDAANVVIQVTPQTVTAGPGTNALFQVRVTNIGNASDTFSLDASTNFTGPSLPDLFGTFANPSPAIAPGQTFTTSFTMAVPTGTAPVNVPIIVEAFGTRQGQGKANASVNVVANGLTLTLVPSDLTTVNINSTAQVTVTNTGSVSDTFTLSLSSAGALVSALASNSVTLAAGASQNVNLTIGNPTFATLGNLPLQVTGTSKANPAITANLSLAILVPASLGITASFQPATQNSPAVFPLIVQNTGSVQDGYSARITKTTGSIQANLANLDGTATQQIPNFQLPGLATGQLVLNVAGTAPGTVTVQITSLTNPAVTAAATATVAAGSSPLAPIANAGSNQSVLVGATVTLDGSASSDPNTPPLPLTYSWTVVSVPAGSGVKNSSITNATSVKASFVPDVAGAYNFQLTVNNGSASNSANVTVTATITAILLPLARVSAPASINAGAALTLDGSASVDQNVVALALTYQWTLVSKPAGSALTSASIQNATAAKASVVLDVAGAFTFQLKVTNTASLSATATVGINSLGVPLAKANAPGISLVGVPVTLDGSSSSDPNTPPLALTYQWTLLTAPAVSTLTSASIQNAASAVATLVVDVAGVYTFQLKVANSVGSATVTVSTTAFLGPVANAGKNRNVPLGKYFMLDGSQSFDPAGNKLTFQWTVVQTPVNSQIQSSTMRNRPTPRPTVITDQTGAYVFQLIVSNGNASSLPSQVTITAYTGNVPPNANAGKPQNAERGVSVSLDGSASFDPDNGPQPLSYTWTVQQAPAGSGLTNSGITGAKTAKAGFVPDVDGVFTLLLTVSDGVASSSDTVAVTAGEPDVAPTARAGQDRRVLPGTLVNLDGTGRFDPDDATVSYQWAFAFGSLSNIQIQNPATAKPSIISVGTGFYVTRLQASDKKNSGFDNVTVMVAGLCDANADGIVDQADFDLISALSGTPALPGDPLDANGDGVIDGKDITACQPQPAPVPSFGVDQTVLVFDYVSGDAKPPDPQTVHVVSGGGSVGFNVSSNSTWVAANPSSGNTNAAVQVSIDPSKLTVGNFSTILTFTALQRANPGQVNVSIVVHFHEAPRLTLTPAVLNFQYRQGASTPPLAQTVSVVAVTRNLAYTATPSASWIVVSPATATTPTIETVSLTNLGSLQPGQFQEKVTFTANDGSGPAQVVQLNLTVLPAPPAITAASVTNAASGITGPVSAGEIVNVSGLYFGPAQLVKSQGTGVVANSLADTQVLFEGVPSPILSVVAGVAQVVVPFFLDGRATASLQVVYQGVVSNLVGLTVAKAEPGVYTVNGNGTGQAMALNADGSPNSAANPAAGGTKLTFYITGGGILNPPGFDGRIAAAPLAKLAQDISVQIGGQTAQATAGDAVGMVEGFVQVDVTVPQNIPAGNAVVVVTIGGAKSQPGVTVAVR